VSSEMWKVHVCPVAAGQPTGIEANMGVFAEQPVNAHLAVALCLLTTNVVVTRVSLLMMVWASAVGGAINASATKLSPPVVSNRCESLITPSS